jgi:hypothetical protein
MAQTGNVKQRDEEKPGSTGPFASDLKNKTQEAASAVTEKARDMASAAGHKADEAVAAVGGGMKSLAGTIREHKPQSGVIGSAGSAAADTLESGGRYLQEQGLTGMAEDLTNLIRRNPITALLIGIGVGFLIARATTSTRS